MNPAKWLQLQWDRTLAWVLVAAGAVALIVGWVGVSGTAYSAEQLPYIISGGIGGIFLLGVGATLWLSADLPRRVAQARPDRGGAAAARRDTDPRQGRHHLMALATAEEKPALAASGPGTASGGDLWSAEDLIRWVLGAGAGGIVIVVSWYVCAGEASFSRQIGPLDAAVAGLVFAGLGNVMWLLPRPASAR